VKVAKTSTSATTTEVATLTDPTTVSPQRKSTLEVSSSTISTIDADPTAVSPQRKSTLEVSSTSTIAAVGTTSAPRKSTLNLASTTSTNISDEKKTKKIKNIGHFIGVNKDRYCYRSTDGDIKIEIKWTWKGRNTNYLCIKSGVTKEILGDGNVVDEVRATAIQSMKPIDRIELSGYESYDLTALLIFNEFRNRINDHLGVHYDNVAMSNGVRDGVYYYTTKNGDVTIAITWNGWYTFSKNRIILNVKGNDKLEFASDELCFKNADLVNIDSLSKIDRIQLDSCLSPDLQAILIFCKLQTRIDDRLEQME